MSRQDKSTALFKQVIEQKLQEIAKKDELFAKNLLKDDKNIDDCISYILNQVKQSGVCGFADDDIFAMATHYYDEDAIEVGTAVKCQIVMNHTVELTEEEKLVAKKEAKANILRYEEERLTKEAKDKFKAELVQQQKENLTDDDISEAKQNAKQQVIDEETKRLTRKPAKAKMTVIKNTKVVTQNSLF